MPDEPEALGLLALMLLHHSRRDARAGRRPATWCCWRTRTARAGTPARSREGLALAARAGAAGPYSVQAQIAAEHSSGGATDWARVAALYDCSPGRGRDRWWS